MKFLWRPLYLDHGGAAGGAVWTITLRRRWACDWEAPSLIVGFLNHCFTLRSRRQQPSKQSIATECCQTYLNSRRGLLYSRWAGAASALLHRASLHHRFKRAGSDGSASSFVTFPSSCGLTMQTLLLAVCCWAPRMAFVPKVTAHRNWQKKFSFSHLSAFQVAACHFKWRWIFARHLSTV